MNSRIWKIQFQGNFIAMITITDNPNSKDVNLLTFNSTNFINHNSNIKLLSSQHHHKASYILEIRDDTIIRDMIIQTITGFINYNPEDFDWIQI